MSNNEIYDKWTNFINNDKYKKYFLDNNIIWLNTLKLVEEYINNYNKKPSRNDKQIEIKQFGKWL
jgi:hypothetical protein